MDEINECDGCQLYGHEYETEPEDLTLHRCTECGDWYRD